MDLGANLDTTSTNGGVTQHTLDLTAPDGFLADPNTVYPVIIDPDITMEKTRDTWVRSGDTTSHGSDFKLIAGKINPATTTNAGPTRSYLKFYNSIVENRTNIEIVSAEMGLWQYYAYDCGGRRMYVYPVGTAWNDTITWANKPATVSGNGATNTTATHGATGCGDGWTKVNLTAMAKAWNAGTVDMQGVRLSVDNENDSAWERRFCSMNPDASNGSCGTAARRPYLDVTYAPYVGLSPTVLLYDTTVENDMPLAPGEHRAVRVNGLGGVPETGTSFVSLKISSLSGAATGAVQLRSTAAGAILSTTGISPSGSTVIGALAQAATSAGTVDIYNSSSAPVSVRVYTTGFQPDGSDQHAAYYSVVSISEEGTSVDQNLATGQKVVRNAAGTVIEGDTTPGPDPATDGTVDLDATIADDPDLVPADEPETSSTAEEVVDGPSAVGLSAVTENATDAPVSLFSATPDGFKIRGGGRKTAYWYQSSYWYHELWRTSKGTRVKIGSVRSRLNQHLNGGDSVKWKMHVEADYISGKSYSAKYEYWCGIDVNNREDYTCDEVDDKAQKHFGPERFAAAKVGDSSVTKWHRFSGATNKRPFPMVKVSISWPGYGVTTIGKMRGWDIVYSDNTPHKWKLAKDGKY